MRRVVDDGPSRGRQVVDRDGLAGHLHPHLARRHREHLDAPAYAAPGHRELAAPAADEHRGGHRLDGDVGHHRLQKPHVAHLAQLLLLAHEQHRRRHPGRRAGLGVAPRLDARDGGHEPLLAAEVALVDGQPRQEPVRRLHLALGLRAPRPRQLQLEARRGGEPGEARRDAPPRGGGRDDGGHVVGDQRARRASVGGHHRQQARHDGTMLKNAMNEASTSLQNWMRTDLLNKVNEVMTHLTVGLYTLVMELFHAIIGVIVSVYILFGKETFINQSKKATYAIFPTERANLLIHIAVKTNEIFGGFIIGKIIDSIIIGILCFIGTSLLNMPYAMLVSVIVGVTNVIPFFGPYIGAIPSAVLIALADPMKGVYFLIFILLLQQFDGNILGPKILGNSTGLSAFWVIVSILLGGGLFGILGMLFGVPAFAVIYYIVKLLLDNQLEKKKLPTESECYNGDSYVDNDGTYFQKKDNMTENEEQKTEENKKEKEE